MKIVIVDENDNEIGVKERSEVEQKDIYRVSSLWVTNSKGEYFLLEELMIKLMIQENGGQPSLVLWRKVSLMRKIS